MEVLLKKLRINGVVDILDNLPKVFSVQKEYRTCFVMQIKNSGLRYKTRFSDTCCSTKKFSRVATSKQSIDLTYALKK